MSNLIHISGIGQAKAVRLIKAIADEGLDLEGSITKVEILSTPTDDSFVVRPNGDEFDFWILCDVLRERCLKMPSVQVEAWCRVRKGMFDLPKGKYYVEFGDAESLLFCDTKGRQFRLVEPEPDEALVPEEIGRAVYQACPQQTLTPLSDGQGVISVGEKRTAKLLKDRLVHSEAFSLVLLVPFFILLVLWAVSTWLYKETVLPSGFFRDSVIPFYSTWMPPILIIMACYSFQSKFVRACSISIGTVLLLFMLAFFANSYIHTEEGIRGQGVIVENVGKDSTTNNYVVQLLTPDTGQATVRMHHDGSFVKGNKCTVVMDRGVLGLLHVDSLLHPVDSL